MNIRGFLFIFVLILNNVYANHQSYAEMASLGSYHREIQHPVHQHSEINDDIYYILATSWTPGFCINNPTKEECLKIEEYTYSQSHLVIHGLWPQNKNGKSLTFCNTVNSNLNSIRHEFDVESKWKRYAPGYYKSGLSDYEWNKHGTCSELNKLDYFTLQIQTLKTLGTPKELTQIKGSSVSHSTLSAYFIRNSSIQPIFICDHNNNLVEVRTCWQVDSNTLTSIQILCSSHDFHSDNCSKIHNIHVY
jgi:ribonuclease I